MLRRRLEARGIEARVRSAGLADAGVPATEQASAVAADLGLDLAGHRSRVLDADLVASSDLVIGLARQHVREAVVLEPSAFGRTFTLKELVRRGRAHGPRPTGVSMADWLAELHEGRSARQQMGESRDDDVQDPIGRRAAVYERVADEIEALVDELVELAWPSDALSVGADPTELAAT